VTLNVGGTATAALSITRGGSFTGSVSLTVTGLPAGVTGTFAPASLDASTTASVLTLSAATSATAGTATLTISIYDATGTTLKRTSKWSIVLVDNATEFRGIMLSMALPNGTPLAPIMSISGKRLFRDRSERN